MGRGGGGRGGLYMALTVCERSEDGRLNLVGESSAKTSQWTSYSTEICEPMLQEKAMALNAEI